MDTLEFGLSAKELRLAHEFIEIQEIVQPTHHSSSGGRFSYRFTPTGIGNAVVILDNQTNEEKDITDYSCW